MLKKLLLVAAASVGLSFVSIASADVEVHWWQSPEKYRVDFEEWYPAHTEVWDTYYTTHKSRYTKYCETHKGWTFCK